MNKELSIIICTLNEEQNIKILLDELQYHINDYDVVVVDGGSIDKTKEIVETFTNVRFEEKKGVGLLFQRIHAVSIINTEYFAFVDADDFILAIDLVRALEFIKLNKLDGLQFRTTSRIQNNNYWQKVWAAYFENIYIVNKNISMLGRPCISKTSYYKELNLNKLKIPIAMEDTFLNRELINKFGILNYKVVPFLSHRLCENTLKENWKKWIRYGKGDAQITTNLMTFISSFYHLFFRILFYRSAKTLFSKNAFCFPGIFLFSTARLIGFFINLFNQKIKSYV